MYGSPNPFSNTKEAAQAILFFLYVDCVLSKIDRTSKMKMNEKSGLVIDRGITMVLSLIFAAFQQMTINAQMSILVLLPKIYQQEHLNSTSRKFFHSGRIF
jgi:hypothetical protein